MALKQRHIRLDKKATNDIKMGLRPTGTWHTPQNTKRNVFEIQTVDKRANTDRASLLHTIIFESREGIEDVCMQARVFRAVRKARREITSKYEVMKYLFVEEMKLIFT